MFRWGSVIESRREGVADSGVVAVEVVVAGALGGGANCGLVRDLGGGDGDGDGNKRFVGRWWAHRMCRRRRQR